MTVRAVLFDLDGMLVDSVPALTAGLNDVLATYGSTPMTEKAVADLVGKGVRKLIEDVFAVKQLPTDDKTIDEACALYVARNVARGNHDAKFFPGALDAVAALRRTGVKTVLVTNKSRAMVETFVRDAGLGNYFDAVVAGDDTPHPKPAGDMLLLGAKKVGVSIADCVMLGDSRNDAEAGRNAGVAVRLVKTGYNEGVPIEIWGPENGFDAVYEDVPAAIKDLTVV